MLREDGLELLVDRRVRVQRTRLTWPAGTEFPRRTDLPESRTCDLQYRLLATGTANFSVSNACRQDQGEGGFAASRSPTGH